MNIQAEEIGELPIIHRKDDLPPLISELAGINGWYNLGIAPAVKSKAKWYAKPLAAINPIHRGVRIA